MAKPLKYNEVELIRKRLPALWANPDVTARDIGARFNCSDNTIRRIAQEMGLGEKGKVRLFEQRREPTHGKGWRAPSERCPLDTEYGETVCRDGILWGLTYGDSGPPGNRQAIGDCPHCAKRKRKMVCE